MLQSTPGKFVVAAFLLLQLASCRSSTPQQTQNPDLAEQPPVVPAMPAPDVAGLEAGVLNYRQSETRLFDLVHTKLQVAFDWQKQHLLGTATLELRPWFYPQNTLVLDAKGFDVHSVKLLEGMKMENVLKSPGDGQVQAILVKKGDSVEKGQILVQF